jgi:hypothetical protein
MQAGSGGGDVNNNPLESVAMCLVSGQEFLLKEFGSENKK